MSIRTKLTLSLALIFAVSLGGLGFLLARLTRSHQEEESLQSRKIIENTVRRAAEDAMIQRDEILLLSYIKFLRSQFPAMAFCSASWTHGERKRTHMVGEKVPGADVSSKFVRVRDPADAARWVTLEIGIDEAYLRERIEERYSILIRDLLRLFGIAIIVCVFFSAWFASRIVGPLGALSTAAKEIGRGKLGVKLDWNSKDEVGELVQGFNRMSLRLAELDTMKKDFVSAVTHELRSPLGAIESFLNLMEKRMVGGRPQDPKQFQVYFDRIKTNVKRLSGFITDLLDVAKIERGKMECTLKPMKIQSVAADVVAFFEAQGREQGVAIENALPAGAAPVEGDEERLRQVLVNLVSNSLKFTPKGGRVVIAGEQVRENGARFIEVSVRDTGRGIPAEDLKDLFGKFEQGSNRNKRVGGSHGTGLGLFIVKSIVEAHGGRVSVKSAPGKGTEFLFNLKLAA